ncbi:MAG: ABC transporter permease [Chelatococcus sp.]|uniref:ABC transporter permease n=1 Tax=unclassified Chelatococcus TaxID=2638111 RepID=UPI001BCA94C7|nr:MULTISPECIES: ABC transporter permease [unclassified Chelatococcus]MBS7741761.1 ABC transporter permease [Chelatococcus sp. HY11]MBX3537717.1 ABC transporter permease [Chelatococcus sp.]MBX3541441.1 ABC transporter permease [Chelatococcus sp.]MCO5074665.1 ABC transporter permease [Chelatococcus sp.]
MVNYILRRILLTVPTLIAVLIICFGLTRISGDPADLMLPIDVSDDARAAFRQTHGLDKPIAEQFLTFTVNALQGDMGRSLRFGEPSLQLVSERLAATSELALAALGLSIAMGIPLGVIAAQRYGSWPDRLIRNGIAVSQAVPSFYVGILLMMVFAVGFGMLPIGGRQGPANLVLPALTLASGLVPLIARVTRSCMLDELGRDYIRTARAKGVKETLIVWKHSLRNACIPLVTVIGLQVGALMSGVVVTETVFAWPGIGRLAIQAIYARDFPVVQAVVLFFSVVFILVNLFVDILYAVMDPRVGYK